MYHYTPDCVLTNPEDVAEGRGQPRLACDGDDDDGDGSGRSGRSGSGSGSGGFLRVQTKRHPASWSRKHVTRPEYVGPTCKLSACFAAGLFPGARPDSEKNDGYLGDDFLAVLSTRCGNPIERVLAKKKWVIPLIG